MPPSLMSPSSRRPWPTHRAAGATALTALLAAFVALLGGVVAAPPAGASVRPASIGGPAPNRSVRPATLDQSIRCASVARPAGFRSDHAVTAVAVGMAESRCTASATGQNGPSSGCPKGSTDRGIWQLNSCYHPEVTDACAYDAACNAQATLQISAQGADWTPWSTYNSGAYRQFLPDARIAVAQVYGSYVVTSSGWAQANGSHYNVVRPGVGNRVYQLYYPAGTGWSAWQDLSGSIASDPAIVYNAGRYDAFGISPAGALMQSTYLDGGWGAWRGATINGAAVALLPGSGVSAVYAGGIYQVFGVGPGRDVVRIYFSDAWHESSWGGSVIGTPAVAYNADRYDVFAVSNGGGVYQRGYNGGLLPWRRVSTAGGPVRVTTDGLGAAYASGRYHVFGVGTGGHVTELTYNGGWRSTDWGGGVTGAPAVVATSSRYDVFAQTAAGSVYQRSLYRSGFVGWHRIAGAPR
ncbi:MAG: hypothetical protein ACR2JQ_04690 [Mycobacteriales bacterium]